MPRFHKMPCKIDQCFRETGTFETNFVFITRQRQMFVAITRHDGWGHRGQKMGCLVAFTMFIFSSRWWKPGKYFKLLNGSFKIDSYIDFHQMFGKVEKL